MILNTTPQDQVVLSNVGEVGDFKIKASAKAFSILSSGLYANKIRAIVRELSCNAVDSHVAAGKQNTPFVVHLPNDLAPWFSIRDYGTGLTHDQVTQIYTTYFESTKTDSNEYIGALGLGSKSPFAYTDNFTVTAIRDNKKGIYSAFINQAGVPSIALMMSEDTTEPNGVEVKFSVNDRYDYSKFRDEALQVYTHFKLRPVVSGSAGFEFDTVEYETKNIIPGVHSKTGYNSHSIAIMGNIAYPIDIPNKITAIGDLNLLLSSNLEMHFEIGELDFQASREGLSYIPQTIEAIKRKLETVNGALTDVLTKEADAIENLWERALFLNKKHRSNLWSSATESYVKNTGFPLAKNSGSGTWDFLIEPSIQVKDLANKYNIAITSFNKDYSRITNNHPNSDFVKLPDGNYEKSYYWIFSINTGTRFVINDLKTGATERAKFHWKNSNSNSQIVYVLSKVDKTLDMDTEGFFNEIKNPPAEWTQVSSTLNEKPRANGVLKNVTILALQQKNKYDGDMVWRDAGKADSFDKNETYYYLPLSGFAPISKVGEQFNVKTWYNDLRSCGIPTLSINVYGVRKGDIEFIKTQKNWINIEEHITQELSAIDNKFIMGLVAYKVDSLCHLRYNSAIVSKVVDVNSPYVELVKQFKGFELVSYNEFSLKSLCEKYVKDTTSNPQDTINKFLVQCGFVYKQYPLLHYLRNATYSEVADYINLINTQRK